MEVVETNITNRNLYTSPIMTDLPMYFGFILVSEKGDTLSFQGGTVYPQYSKEYPGYFLRSGEKLIYVKNLLAIFGESPDTAHHDTFLLPEGRYTLQAAHRTNYQYPIQLRGKIKNEMPAITRTIFSNVGNFEIVAPRGEDKVAHEQLMKARKIRHDEKIDGIQNITLYKQLIDAFPNHVYTLTAYRELGRSYKRMNIKVHDLLAKYANHRFSFELLDRLGIGHLRTTPERQKSAEKLNDCLEKYPSTVLARYAEYKLNKIERLDIIPKEALRKMQ